MSFPKLLLLGCAAALAAPAARAASTAERYYAHAVKQDRHGVIAPWYEGQNGQLDFRARIAAETLKRYPWADKSRAVAAAPEYLYNGKWNIEPDGRITVLEEADWNNGDLVQRAANTINAWERFYPYSGDPAAFTHIAAMANYLVEYCQTGADHGWPRFPISVPTVGARYGACRLGAGEDVRANGKIQLDIAAEAGLALVRAYEMTGNRRWYEAARHWADLLAANRNRTPGEPPWGRYAANSGGNGMTIAQKGGVAFVLTFLDELIRTGYTGKEGALLEAREDGRRYLRESLLPAWTFNDTWGRNYWDGEGSVHQANVSEFNVQYMMDHPDQFPNWQRDVRNILTLFMHHTTADPGSAAEVYHGAWAYPESENCCGQSLVYVPMRFAADFARYAALSGSEWAREMARRQIILATYDAVESGWAEDLVFGGAQVYRNWFKITHPMALRHVLGALAWLPDVLGANRENHIMRSSSVVSSVVYGDGDIRYTAFDAPPRSIDVLRLAFEPAGVSADGRPLSRRGDLSGNGYTLRKLAGGDVLVTIRRDGCRDIRVWGDDPQAAVDSPKLSYTGAWRASMNAQDHGGSVHQSGSAGAEMRFAFTGNQVRVIGRTGPSGGRADVFVDGVKQAAGIDFYTPAALYQQVVYYRSGLANGSHTLRIAVRGERNPVSEGNEAMIDAVQHSAATGEAGFGEGGGPTETQRFLFGYTGRQDYVDSQGNPWRPGAEVVARTGRSVDPVARTWWTMKRQRGLAVASADPDLYLYGIHWPEFIVNVTTGPGVYHARLKFAETEVTGPGQRVMDIYVNGERKAAAFDVFAAGGGAARPVDLVFNGIRPKNGVIDIRLAADRSHGCRAEAMLQALEVGPGDGGPATQR
ncbi:MAG: malectin domain-containing carbohydrate-binding protein [Bryobacteraceae bacterium]